MYRTIIEIKDDIPDSTLGTVRDVVLGAFLNRAGALTNVSASPYEFIFECDESGYGCLELGVLNLYRVNGFISYVSSWEWIDDEEPSESYDVLRELSVPVN